MEYSAGRYSLSEFVSAPTTKTHSYFHAVYHFSASIGQAWQFFDLNRTKTRHRTGAQIDFFKPNDASVLEKLNVIYNKSKHTVADYESIHQPLWITNRGIATDSMELTFHDLREILEQMSTWCRMFLDPDRQHGRSNSIEECEPVLFASKSVMMVLSCGDYCLETKPIFSSFLMKRS